MSTTDCRAEQVWQVLLTSLMRPNSTSVASVRSCASSRMMTLYRSSSGSLIASRSSMPSVMNLCEGACAVTQVPGHLQSPECIGQSDLHACVT